MQSLNNYCASLFTSSFMRFVLTITMLMSMWTATLGQLNKTKEIALGESSRNRSIIRLRFVTPGVLIVVGTALMFEKDADEFFLSNFEVREERNENFINFSNHLDDYLQHVPSASTFLAGVSGVRGRHDLPNQIALYVKSELTMLSIVYALKYSVGEARPDTGQKNSFPSGHTAQAFTAATFLSREYGYRSIWISVGAYTAASTVGVFRMLNNRHWVSDVLVGAGIGIVSTNLIYGTHKNKWGKHPKAGALRIDPFSAYGSTGISLRYRI